MTTLNLTSQQQANALIAIGAGNAVYNLNNGGLNLVKGLPLQYVPDVTQQGYTQLPAAPAGYTVTMVHNDPQSGLNMFVAYNKDTHTAIVGIAGINGVLGTDAGAATDNLQMAAKKSQAQIDELIAL